MPKFHFKRPYAGGAFFLFMIFLLAAAGKSWSQEAGKNQGPPPVPVKIALTEQRTVFQQISLIGTAEPITQSMVAAEVEGIVESYPVKQGDFVHRGDILTILGATDLKLRLKAAKAKHNQIQANLLFARKEYDRAKALIGSNSIAEKIYDEANYQHQALMHELAGSEAQIEQLEYEIRQKTVVSPLAGFIAKEHTQMGEWVNRGGPVVTLLDLSLIQITVDVPERYAVMLSVANPVKILISSLSDSLLEGKIHAVLSAGNSDSRTIPVLIHLANPEFKILGGMEATVFFDLPETKSALVVPKDAVVTAGANRLVFAVFDGKAVPVNIKILGYYDGYVAVEGGLQPAVQVVVRGNERLMPGQAVQPAD